MSDNALYRRFAHQPVAPSGRTVRDPGYSGAACAFQSGVPRRRAHLQVSIEACIGVAKHWAKTLAGHTPQDAYQASEILAQRGELSPTR